MYFTDNNRIKYFQTLIETPAPQRKKALEAFYVELFLQTPEGIKWRDSKQLLTLPNQESPDFLFLSKKGHQQGLELTTWVNNTGQCRVNQILSDIARDICMEVKNTKGINLSLLIDVYDPRAWEYRTRKEYFDYLESPGVKRLKENAKKIKKIFLDTIQTCEKITEEFTDKRIVINEQYFRLVFNKSWFWFPEFYVNNNKNLCEKDIVISLQNLINNKNKKYSSFLKHCSICDLLIVYPFYHTGNPIFSDTTIIFKSYFPNIFLLYWNGKDISVTELKTVNP